MKGSLDELFVSLAHLDTVVAARGGPEAADGAGGGDGGGAAGVGGGRQRQLVDLVEVGVGHLEPRLCISRHHTCHGRETDRN